MQTVINKLKPDDIVFCDGCYLILTESGEWKLQGVEDELWRDGLNVLYDEENGYHTEENV